MYHRADEIKTAIMLSSISVVLTGFIIFWYVNNPEKFIKEGLGIQLDVFDRPFVWIFALCIAVGYILYTVTFVPFVKKYLFTFSWLKLIGIWAAIVSSTVEEIVFRKVLMDWLMNLDFSITIQIFVSAVIFGLAHGAWVFLRGEFKIAFPVILATTVLGALLAILYILGDRNILAPIVAHLLINLFIEPWLMLSAVSGKWVRSTVEIKA